MQQDEQVMLEEEVVRRDRQKDWLGPGFEKTANVELRACGVEERVS
jgi:hypothetical protein